MSAILWLQKSRKTQPELPGVTIEQDYIRQYEDSKYFSNITGYCGQISEDELEYFKTGRK